MFFIVPSVNLFLNGTPNDSSLSHASSTFGTVMAMCPKPRPGSVFPLAYPWNSGSDSVPWLWVSSRMPSRVKRFSGVVGEPWSKARK